MSRFNSLGPLDNQDDDFSELEELLTDRRLAARYFQRHPLRKFGCRLLRLRLAVQPYRPYATAFCILTLFATSLALPFTVLRAEQQQEAARITEEVGEDSRSLRSALNRKQEELDELRRKMIADKQSVAETLHEAAQVSSALHAKLEQCKHDVNLLNNVIEEFKKTSQAHYNRHLAAIDDKFATIKREMEEFDRQELPVGAIVAATKDCKPPKGSWWLPATGGPSPENRGAPAPDSLQARLPDVAKSFILLEAALSNPSPSQAIGLCGDRQAAFMINSGSADSSTQSNGASSAPISGHYSFLVKVRPTLQQSTSSRQ